MDWKQSRAKTVRAVGRGFFYSLLFIAVYFLMLFVPVPSIESVGMVRALIAALLARVAESTFYKMARETGFVEERIRVNN